MEDAPTESFDLKPLNFPGPHERLSIVFILYLNEKPHPSVDAEADESAVCSASAAEPPPPASVCPTIPATLPLADLFPVDSFRSDPCSSALLLIVRKAGISTLLGPDISTLV